jgi:hypothetical protein
LYIKQTSDYIFVIILYVDDLIILSSDVTKLKWLKSQLEKEFKMSDLGELNYYLGVQFQKNRKTHTITMSQTTYIEEVLRRFNMKDCKPVVTPSDANSKLLKLSDEKFGNVQMEMEGMLYKAAVGSLMYAMVGTHPDFAFAVSTVSQFMAKAGPSHWMAMKRILRYLKGGLELKLSLGGNDISLVGFCDADWAGDTNDRRSTTGYVFLVGRGSISWKCKKQSTIALSTTQAEYMATTQCTKEAIWLRQLLADVGYVQEEATSIMCDNQGCIQLAKNPMNHSRTKHIDIQHHFIKEKLETEEICLSYCPTEHMIADLLTKTLANDRHHSLSRAIGLEVFDNPQSGNVEGKILNEERKP